MAEAAVAELQNETGAAAAGNAEKRILVFQLSMCLCDRRLELVALLVEGVEGAVFFFIEVSDFVEYGVGLLF
jgi:hypothetical protein